MYRRGISVSASVRSATCSGSTSASQAVRRRPHGQGRRLGRLHIRQKRPATGSCTSPRRCSAARKRRSQGRPAWCRGAATWRPVHRGEAPRSRRHTGDPVGLGRVRPRSGGNRPREARVGQTAEERPPWPDRRVRREVPGSHLPARPPAARRTPCGSVPADCAFPSATQNEISGKDADNLRRGRRHLVAEGANMPTTPGRGPFRLPPGSSTLRGRPPTREGSRCRASRWPRACS